MVILERVKTRLGAETVGRDKEIQGYIDDITDKIKSVCNRVEFPKELEYLVVKYAMNCTVFYENGYGKEKQLVSSVSDNGQSVSFKDVGAVTADDVNIDKYIEKNKDEISMYAYMR